MQKSYVFSGAYTALGQYTAGYLLGEDCARSLVSQLSEPKIYATWYDFTKNVSFNFYINYRHMYIERWKNYNNQISSNHFNQSANWLDKIQTLKQN